MRRRKGIGALATKDSVHELYRERDRMREREKEIEIERKKERMRK